MKAGKYNINCQCKCLECESDLIKKNYYTQGYCNSCGEWKLTDEIDDCDYCMEVRKKDIN